MKGDRNMQRTQRRVGATLGVLALAITGNAVHAGEAGGFFDDMNINFAGFVRAESAISTTGQENPNNQGGNIFNSQTVARTAYLPPALGGGQWGAIPLGVGGNQQLGGLLPPIAFTDEVRRGDFIDADDNAFNYTILRAETEMQLTLTDHWSVIGRLRAIYDPTIYQQFNPGSVGGVQGAIDGGEKRLYKGRPNMFEYIVEGGDKPNPLEWSGKDYLVYFPALLAEYTSGGLNLRVGNQQLAWGQSIFFRVFDVANGLDLRRHLIMDRALEEFSDKRVPQLSVRLSYQLSDTILLDSFVAKFQPTVFGNPNTPYNVIPAQFTVHDLYKEGGYDSKLNYGLRLKGDYGQVSFQLMATRRYNPDGVFRWTESGVQKPLSGLLGTAVNLAYSVKPQLGNPDNAGACSPTLCRLYDDISEALSHTPFEASPAGVYSAREWFNYAAQVRLDGVAGLNAAIEEFAASRDVFATPADNYDQAYAELDTFFIAAGGSMRGHIARQYFREDVFGVGASYVNESENDLLNQMIFNLEVQYTPERTFTNKGLSRNFVKQDEYTVSLVVDKWHRFFNEFPGTYILFQALTKNRSDLVGRHLGGFGGSENKEAPGKSGNSNYLVLGFLQPWPNKIYEIEFAALVDLEGGMLAQPGLRWNAGKSVTVEGFYNFVDGRLWGNPNDNLLSTIDFAEEFTLRVSYQF
ncbi:hypothetical protein DFR24_0394 [Panacagrimonas perspica]|uniref:DUF1302 family protein n=2 Tax=Panacagrimonas perspica TaxID=381431 RepID=A0A4V3F617_9GAMM|nr:hypothetical protein DFR24_0394 [Panacagrimonas perspica]